ncbi:MAG: hypothetical protein HQL85_18690 [Magnetococcales bacterium]|nr:hypothetical protein [Magnetococcales bacterium]
MAMNGYDFDNINARALSRFPDLLFRWFPSGRLHGHEFKVGNIHGDPGDSLSINVHTGQWADFATNDRGGDPISLNSARLGLRQGDAARELMGDLGLESVSAHRSAAKERHEQNQTTWDPIIPIPEPMFNIGWTAKV